MIGFKGFTDDWKTFNEMKFDPKSDVEYEEKENIKLCKNGFHFCKFPLDVLKYYPIFRLGRRKISHFNKYAIINTNDEDVSKEEHENDTKKVTSKFKIDHEISIKDIIRISSNMVREKNECLRKKITKTSHYVKGYFGEGLKLAISKINCFYVYNNNYRSMAIGTGIYDVDVISDGDSSIAISNCSNAIANGHNSISVKTNIGISSNSDNCITTGYQSISVQNTAGNCISLGNRSICSSSSNYSLNSISYGDNSIIANQNNYNVTNLVSLGNNSIISSIGGNKTILESLGKNSVCIFMPTEKPDKEENVYRRNAPLFKGKLGNIFIVPIYDNDLNIIDFNIKKVDGEEIKENIFYMYTDNKFIECPEYIEFDEYKN